MSVVSYTYRKRTPIVREKLVRLSEQLDPRAECLASGKIIRCRSFAHVLESKLLASLTSVGEVTRRVSNLRSEMRGNRTGCGGSRRREMEQNIATSSLKVDSRPLEEEQTQVRNSQSRCTEVISDESRYARVIANGLRVYQYAIYTKKSANPCDGFTPSFSSTPDRVVQQLRPEHFTK
jgi:hypothetical protein